MASVDRGFFNRRGACTKLVTTAGDYATAAPSSKQGSAGFAFVYDRANSSFRRNGYVTLPRKQNYRIAVSFREATSRFGITRPTATIVLNGAANFTPRSPTVYKMRGAFGGAFETWVSTISPFAAPPSGNAVTDVSHVKSTG